MLFTNIQLEVDTVLGPYFSQDLTHTQMDSQIKHEILASGASKTSDYTMYVNKDKYVDGKDKNNQLLEVL